MKPKNYIVNFHALVNRTVKNRFLNYTVFQSHDARVHYVRSERGNINKTTRERITPRPTIVTRDQEHRRQVCREMNKGRKERRSRELRDGRGMESS